MNKRGYSTGFAWVFGLITIFGLGIMYIVFNQVFVGHLVPIIKGQANYSFTSGGIDNSSLLQINTGIDKYMDFFHAMPFILFIIVIIFMLISAIRKERETQ